MEPQDSLPMRQDDFPEDSIQFSAADARHVIHQLWEMRNIVAPSSILPALRTRLGLEKQSASPCRSVEALTQALHDANWQVRMSAVKELELLGEQAPKELLAIALNDENKFVHMMAIHVLNRCGKALCAEQGSAQSTEAQPADTQGYYSSMRSSEESLIDAENAHPLSAGTEEKSQEQSEVEEGRPNPLLNDSSPIISEAEHILEWAFERRAEQNLWGEEGSKVKMKLAANALPNELLRYEREQRHWTQEDVAEQIGAPDPKMVGKWERGVTTPQLHYSKKLAELFEKSVRELGLVRRGEVPYWNIPYPQNPFFTGREDILARLHEALKSDKIATATQPYALTGLGGVGKTQTAIEYAHRYRSKYHAVLWVRADSHEVLTSDFATLAALLGLAERNERNLGRTIAAVKQWLTTITRWLLILDNADNLQLINDVIPSPLRGHVLLTTRTNMTGALAHAIVIDTMEASEGAYFLLRRAKMIALDASQDKAPEERDYSQAREISQALGGLPLALDQAGAYIEETKCSLPDYLTLYQTRREPLLEWRGDLALDHPDPVATTWSLSFEKILQANPVATELLKVCAFLAPDAIPEEIISEGAPDLGPLLRRVATDPFKLNVVIKELLKFSLIRRNPESKTLTIHRLVQVVKKDRMDEHAQRQCAERVVRAVNRVFPDAEFSTWPLCQRYLAQAQACALLISQWGMKFAEAARLLDRVGRYLYQRASYAEAESFYQQALEIYEQVPGPEHPDVAITLSNLASLYWNQNRHALAEPLLLRSLSIREQALADHPDVATSLNYQRASYAEAESFYQQALEIREQVPGPEHPDVATTLSNLASLYWDQSKYMLAEPLLLRSLSILEETLGPDHPEVAICLNALALLYKAQNKYAQAVPIILRALSIRERALGPEHPDVASTLNDLAMLYYNEDEYAQAEPLFIRALAIRERVLGPEHPDVASSLNYLAALYSVRGQHGQAEPLLLRALPILEQELGPEHPDVATSLNNLALLYTDQDRYSEAEPLLLRACTIIEQVHGNKHPSFATALNNLALLYHAQHKFVQAEQHLLRALAISEKALGSEHPLVAMIADNYARLLWETERRDEALQYQARARAIWDKRAG